MRRFDSFDDKATPGPADYEPVKVKKNVGAVKFYYRPGAAPKFNDNNPLNYVRPITVNVYFKSENPGPNYYDVTRPQTQAY